MLGRNDENEFDEFYYRSIREEENRTADILTKIENGVPRTDEERRFLRGKLNAMLTENNEFIPPQLQAMTVRERFHLASIV